MNIISTILKRIVKMLPTARERSPGEPLFICNLQPSPPDDRDHLFAVSPTDVPLPRSISFEEFVTPIKQQGSIGSCGSHAWTTGIETKMNLKDNIATDNDYIPLSELFHYYVVRQPDFGCTFPKDSGQYLRDGARVCLNVGVSPEKLCPYDVSKFNINPSLWAWSFARFSKITSYNRCWDVNAMKQSLAGKTPVVFGISVYQNIFGTDADGRMSPPEGFSVGGHALCACGYNDDFVNKDGTLGAVRFANSWGTSWGNRGFGWVPYSYLSTQMIEAWTFTVN